MPTSAPTLPVGAISSAVSVVMRVDMTYPSSASQLQVVVVGFQNDTANALNVPVSRIQVTNTSSGSIIFTFLILPSSVASQPSPASLLTELETQLNDATHSSPIYQGAITANSLPTVSSSAVVMQLCSDGSWKTYGQCPAAQSTPPGSSQCCTGCRANRCRLLLLLLDHRHRRRCCRRCCRSV